MGLKLIHHISINGHAQLAELLLQHNCNIECETEELRWRPIHYACKNGHLELVQLFLQHNCNIECETYEQWRPIHCAIEIGHVKIVKLLLQQNCNIDCKTKEGYSPMELARRKKNKGIVNILNGSKLLIACKNKILTNVSSLLDNADIEYCDEDNRRPIHWACLNNHNEIVKLLIKRNCNIDSRDNTNLSPIEIAKNNNNEELIKILTAETDRQFERQISRMGLTCGHLCDHSLCPKSLKEKTFHKGSDIGSGSFGEVSKVQASGTGKEIAMKKIRLKHITVNSIEGNIDKFLPIFTHARIVQYFYATLKGKSLCIFMEYMPGGSLHDKIKKEKSIQTEEILVYCKQILEGLEFLHENNIIHRDLKPANIMINNDNNIKLADFGISRSLIRADGMPTDAHTVVGTLNFMAPEIMNNEPYNISADIWSLGATIINMITGKPPYHNYQTVKLIQTIATTKKLELPEPQLMSNEMKIFIERILNKNPNSRPTAAELLKSNLFF